MSELYAELELYAIKIKKEYDKILCKITSKTVHLYKL